MTLFNRTNDDFDRIYNSDGTDNIIVSKGFNNFSYDSSSGKSRIHPMTNKDVQSEGGKSIFKFFADNTVHEYSMNEFQNSKTGEKSGFVHTSFDKGIVRGGTNEVESRMNSNINLLLTRDIHSHPGGGINSESVYPSDFYPKNWTGPGLSRYNNLGGDVAYYRNLKAQFKERINIDFEVYVPKAPTVKIFYNDKKAVRTNNGVGF